MPEYPPAHTPPPAIPPEPSQQPPQPTPGQPTPAQGAYRPSAPRKSGSSGCLIGCLIAFVVGVILLGVGGFLVYKYAKPIIANAIHTGIEQMVTQSNLPADQQKGVMEHVTHLRDDFKSGKISMEQLARVMQEFQTGPLLPSLMVWAGQQHVNTSGLSEEEKADAKLQVQRYVRGVFEETIPRFSMYEVLDPISTPGPQGQPQMKQSVSDEDLRRFIALLRKKADEHMIPSEPYQPDIAAEVGRMIDQAVNREGPRPVAPPPEPQPPEPPPPPAPPQAEDQ